MKTTKASIQLLGAFLLVSAILVTPGCFIVVAGAAGAGTVAYVRGELDATLDKPLDAVAAAADDAIAQLQFAKISESKDAFTADLIARTAEDKKIEIKITKKGDGVSGVAIRIGLFGDEEKSRAILDKINANL